MLIKEAKKRGMKERSSPFFCHLIGPKLLPGKTELPQIMNNLDFWKDSGLTQHIVVPLWITTTM